MRALTICQPYAHLIIVTQVKRVENREWPTAYRGPLVIHAGKSRAWLDGEKPGPDMVFGAALGVVDMIDCLHIDQIDAGLHDAQYPWLREHAHTNGTWCHLYANVRPFPAPIPWKGAQGFWNFPDSSLPAGILGTGSAP